MHWLVRGIGLIAGAALFAQESGKWSEDLDRHWGHFAWAVVAVVAGLALQFVLSR
jgi:hypothetical protein